MSTIYNSQKQRSQLILALVALGVGAVSCGRGQNGNGNGGTLTSLGGSGAASTTIPLSIPSDSTGSSGTMAVSFGTLSSSAALMLTSTSLDVGGGVTLDTARINIAAIKVKAAKEQTADEKNVENNEASENASDKTAEDAEADAEKAVVDNYATQIAAATTGADKTQIESERDAKIAALKAARAQSQKATDDAKLSSEASQDLNTRWKGPFVYDAVSGTLSSQPIAVSLADGTYRRIEFQLKPYRDGAGTDPLLNNVMYIHGSVLLGTTAHPFSLSYHVAENFRLGGAGGVKVEPGVSNPLAIAFDVKSWFSGVDFSKATQEADGSIVVDKNSNQAILKVIRNNLKADAYFGKPSSAGGQISQAAAAGDGSEALQQEQAASTTN